MTEILPQFLQRNFSDRQAPFEIPFFGKALSA
jgi:hypothetical protein